MPYSALVECPPYNFTGMFSDVCFSALCNQPVVISTTVRAWSCYGPTAAQ